MTQTYLERPDAQDLVRELAVKGWAEHVTPRYVRVRITDQGDAILLTIIGQEAQMARSHATAELVGELLDVAFDPYLGPIGQWWFRAKKGEMDG